MTKASLSGLAFLIDLAQERDSPGGFAALDPLRACGALRASLKNACAFPRLRTLAGSNPCAGNKKASRSGPLLQSTWRRERDSNPRNTCVLNGFQDRRIQPLCHLSGALGNDSIERDVTCAGFPRAMREVRGCRDEASR